MFTLSDAWFLAVLILINDKTNLSQLIAGGDVINRAIFTKEEVNNALSKFIDLNFVEMDQNKNMYVTRIGLSLRTKSFDNSGLFSKVEILSKSLSKFHIKKIETIEYFSEDDINKACIEYLYYSNINKSNL